MVTDSQQRSTNALHQLRMTLATQCRLVQMSTQMVRRRRLSRQIIRRSNPRLPSPWGWLPRPLLEPARLLQRLRPLPPALWSGRGR